jgi:hypothetical protein
MSFTINYTDLQTKTNQTVRVTSLYAVNKLRMDMNKIVHSWKMDKPEEKAEN